jgi:2-keto-4-pentenoate hydratase/2-oxohepta-3-ene-1,7-dioic acid hydratase in catechol pathway
MSVYARYEHANQIHYGLVESGKVAELSGDLFDKPTPTGKTHALSDVKLLAPCHLESRPAPSVPGIFYKPTSSIQNPGDPIVIPQGSTREQAQAAIFGVTCGNDVSDRNSQRGEGKDLQWWRGKGCDTFSPLDLFIDTGLNYGDLALETKLNCEIVRSQRTSSLISDVPEVIGFISQWVTLLPGDTDEVTIEGIGTLSNPVA